MQLNKEVVVKKQILFLNNKRKSYESMFFMGWVFFLDVLLH